MSPEDRLGALGIELPAPPPSLASYARTVRHDNLVYVSGQLPLVGGSLVHTGKLGAELSTAQGVRAARQCVINTIAALKAEVGELSAVVRIVKVTAFVASDPLFTGQSQVVDGASDLLLEIFGDAGRHARSAVGVACL